MRLCVALVASAPLLVALGCEPDPVGDSGPRAATDSARDSATDSGSDTADTADTADTGEALGCGGVDAFDRQLSPTSELHVAADGSDGGDGSAANPFGTLERAAQAAGPGVAITVHAGAYAGGEYIEDLRGEPSAPIWIRGAEGEDRPVFTGGSDGLHFVRPAWLVLEGLEVTGASDNGINVDDGGDYDDDQAARGLVIRNVSVHDVGGSGNQDCIKLSGVYDFALDELEVARCGGSDQGSGVDMVGCHDGVIARSAFTTMSGNAVQAKGGTEYVDIRWNRIEDGGERAVNLGGSTGFEYFRPPLSTTAPNAEAREIHVVSNLILGSWSPLAFVGCVGCSAVGNTLIDPGHWVVRILQETVSSGEYTFEPSSGGTFANNLVYYDLSLISTFVNVGPDTSPESFTFSHDMWYAHDDPSRSAPTGLPVTEDASITGVDPGFLDADGAIGPASPAVGAGMGSSLLSADRLGACYADPPSIGAVEGNPVAP